MSPTAGPLQVLITRSNALCSEMWCACWAVRGSPPRVYVRGGMGWYWDRAAGILIRDWINVMRLGVREFELTLNREGDSKRSPTAPWLFALAAVAWNNNQEVCLTVRAHCQCVYVTLICPCVLG